MSRVRRVLKPLLTVLIVLCAGYFFFRAFQRNWADIRAHDFRLSVGHLIGSALAYAVAVLLGTWAWGLSINALSSGKVDFRQSVAVVNASSLTKYIPGKLWSYALQMYWLDGLGFSKALIVYVNLMNLAISLGVSLILGLLCLALTVSTVPLVPLLAVIAGLVVLDICAILFNRAVLNGLITLVNRWFKREFSYFRFERSLLLKLHAIHVTSALIQSVGIYAFCFAIGYPIAWRTGLLVIGSGLVGEVAGFLAIIVPGGIGVREGLMYALMGGASTGSLAIVMPVASRLLTMAVDVLLGLVALKLLQQLVAAKRAADARSNA